MNPFAKYQFPSESGDQSLNERFRTEPRTHQDQVWKKIVADKLFERINRSRKARMDDLLYHKKEMLKMLNPEEDVSTELLIGPYLDKLLSFLEAKREDPSDLSEFTNKSYLTSVCPICGESVIAFQDKVMCINGCINIDLPNSEYLSENFSLDNLIDLYLMTKKQHINCGGKIDCITIENDIVFFCEKCRK